MTRSALLRFVPSLPLFSRIRAVLARHYRFTEEELDFIIDHDTCLRLRFRLRRGYGRQVKYRLGRDAGELE